jgi:hypothetical protein
VESGGVGLRQIIFAVAGAIFSFCLTGMAIYYQMAHVKVNGLLHGGPTALAAAMTGLFGGGVVAVVVLILLLRRR